MGIHFCLLPFFHFHKNEILAHKWDKYSKWNWNKKATFKIDNEIKCVISRNVKLRSTRIQTNLFFNKNSSVFQSFMFETKTNNIKNNISSARPIFDDDRILHKQANFMVYLVEHHREYKKRHSPLICFGFKDSLNWLKLLQLFDEFKWPRKIHR